MPTRDTRMHAWAMTGACCTLGADGPTRHEHRDSHDPAMELSARMPNPDPSEIELSVVMPCLNEVHTLGTCIRKIRRVFEEQGIVGEIVVADNGSTDGSIDLAKQLGVRLVPVSERGYGSALMGGISAAQGRFVLMGDADDSYDFLEIPKFLEELRKGYDLVQGCRLPAGGGTILSGAMPLLHRWLGNPFLSAMVRVMFRAPVSDIYCGMRGFTKSLYDRLDQRCTGMEFATEMIIKATIHGASIAEVPITLHPDGRQSHGPHLRTFRDGWRTVRFFMMYSPNWLFRIPGLALIAVGILGYAIALPRWNLVGVNFDAHTLLVASLSILLGYQSVLFALLAKTFAINEGLHPPDPRMERMAFLSELETMIGAGSVAFLAGVALILVAVRQWWTVDFGDLDYAQTMRWVIPGVTLAALGFQTVLSGFILSLLRMGRR